MRQLRLTNSPAISGANIVTTLFAYLAILSLLIRTIVASGAGAHVRLAIPGEWVTDKNGAVQVVNGLGVIVSWNN